MIVIRLPRSSGTTAFTLIELLIVVSVVAILSAVALPNFLEAQCRAKVARVRADHRTLATALEAYYADQGAYPSAEINGTMKWAKWITTPVAYLSRVHIDDPFTGPTALGGITSIPTYRYYGFNEQGYVNADTNTGELIAVYNPPGMLMIRSYLLFSHGPDQVRSKTADDKTMLQADILFHPARFVELIYDPTNGTTSNGEILRAGGWLDGRAGPSLRLAAGQ